MNGTTLSETTQLLVHLMPVVEPELLIDGNQSRERFAEVPAQSY